MLCVDLSVLCCPHEPLFCLVAIFGKKPALVIEKSEDKLGVGKLLVSGFANPLRSLVFVVWFAWPLMNNIANSYWARAWPC